MKESKYNLYRKTEKGVICFNSFHYSFLLLSQTLYANIKDGAWSSISINTLNQLLSNGILVDKKCNEYDLLMQEHEKAKEESATFHLTLLPTLDCNLRCWYCFERHIHGSHMSQETQENIVKYIHDIAQKQYVKNINIELFGGEPLLFFENELYPLLNNIKEIIEGYKKNVDFLFVTNATTISHQDIPLFAALKAKFQISIDGYKEKHNQIKFDINTREATYEKVIDTIHSLCACYDECKINLRINYDNDTLRYIPQVIQDISDIERKKITIHLERVWQTDGDNASSSELKNMIGLILGNRFTVSYMNLFRRSYACKSSKTEYAVISYDGKVYKCIGRNFTLKHQEGILNENGIIQWDEIKKTKRLSIQTYQDPKCKECKILPLCWGPCNQKCLEYPNEISKFCQLDNMEISLDDFVYMIFNNQLIKDKYHGNI